MTLLENSTLKYLVFSVRVNCDPYSAANILNKE